MVSRTSTRQLTGISKLHPKDMALQRGIYFYSMYLVRSTFGHRILYSNGSAKLHRQVTENGRIISASAINTALARHRIMDRRQHGSFALPKAGYQSRSSTSQACTTRARGSRRMLALPSNGTQGRRGNAKNWLCCNLGRCTKRELA